MSPEDPPPTAEVGRARSTATSASRTTRRIHHFYDQLCPACAEFNFAQAHRARRPARARRAAHRRAREDRLPGGPQAAARRRAAHRHHALPARLGRALRARARLRRVGRTGSRSSGSICATRRASRRSAAHLLATRDRLDFIINNACQTVRRPPDFYEHMMARRDGRAARPARPSVRAAARRVRGPARLPPAARRRAPRGTLPAAAGRALSDVAGLTHAAELSQVPLLPEELRGAEGPLPRRPARPGPAAGRPARAQLVAAAARRGAVGRAARGAARQRHRAVHPQRAAQAADAAHARARQAHRQRLGDRGAVLPQLQDHAASAHQHGQGRAQHDDAHLGRRLPQRRHPHEQRGHRLGDGRGPGRDRRAQDGRAPLPPAARHRRRRGAHRRPDHRRRQHRGRTSGGSS